MATNGESKSINQEGHDKTPVNKRNTESVCDVIYRVISMILFPDPNSSLASSPLLHRIRTALAENFPLLRDATPRLGHSVLLWTRRGSPLRALLVISVGTIILLALTGLLVFLIFLLVATFNAVIISLLISLAATAGFLAIFFVWVTTIYIGALTIAAFVISAVTFTAIVSAMIFTGWIGLFWIVWLATKKSADIAKRSLGMSSTALSVWSSQQSRTHCE